MCFDVFPYNELIRNKIVRVVERWPVALKVLGSNPQMGSPRIFEINFHLQKLSNLSIACDIKLEGALYSVFYAEASKRPWTSLNE